MVKMWQLFIVLLHASSFTLTTSENQCLKHLPEVFPKKFLQFERERRNIVLETSRRTTHQITTNIFKIFLQEVLGYPDVVVILRNDNFDNTSTVFKRLAGPLSDAKSLMPDSMINLEVWSPPDENVVNSMESHYVTDYGITGPPTRFCWFVPTSLSKILPGVDHWRFFAEPETAKYFDLSGEIMDEIEQYTFDYSTMSYYCSEEFCTNGTYTPERCNTSPCATLLSGYGDTTGFVIDHIETLNMYVKVVWVGLHLQHLVANLTRRLDNRNESSLVFLSWTPSIMSIPGDGNFIVVSFPPCETFDSTLKSCKYDLHRIVKLAWSKLKTLSVPIYHALLHVSFSLDDYQKFLQFYRNETDNKPLVTFNKTTQIIENIACSWLQTNQQVWNIWLTKVNSENDLYIGGIFPLSGPAYAASSIAYAAGLARDAVANSNLLQGYSLKLLSDDGKCQADSVMKVFIGYIMQNHFKQLVGILGPACSDTVEPLAGVSRHFHTVVISYSAEGSSFSDREKYPYFFRTIGENNQYQQVYLQLLNKMKWTRIGALTEDGHRYTEYLSHLHVLLRKNNITFDFNSKFPPQGKKDIKQYLQVMKTENVRIIIGDVYDDAARDVMCTAYQLGMTAYQSYVWFLPGWLNSDWYDTDKYNNKYNESVGCTTSEMLNAVNGYFSLSHAAYAPDESTMQENITVKEWKEKFMRGYLQSSNTTLNETGKHIFSDYAGYAYDAVWMYALALDKLKKEDPAYLSALHYERTTQRLVKILGSTDFIGVSGRIQFRGRASRTSVVNVIQWYYDGEKINMPIVGSFVPNTSLENPDPLAGTLYLNESVVRWLNPDKTRPKDGTSPKPKCLVESFKNLLGVQDCEIAIVIANVMGFGFLGIILMIIFMRVYHKYQKELQIYKESDVQKFASKLDEWEIPRDRVVINRKLGEGAFGYVYGGEALFNENGINWVAVAVKTLKIGSSSEEKLDFLSEAEIMKRFDHANIIKLLGVCTKNEPVYTIMEFMLYGDLKTYLLARRHLVNEKERRGREMNGLQEESNEISSKRLTSMALDIARALSYLAELKFVHRDVACRNALVNASRVVKLGDFGMTRPMFENDYYRFNRKGMLPVRWMAPESLGLGIFTPSSDVWSYGVLLYEIITFGSFPFQGMTNNQVLEHVKAGNTLKIPSKVNHQLEALIRSCWNIDHKTRPKASEIVAFLAQHPRLVTPCLDVPLASVQIEDNGQGDPLLPEQLRKLSFPFRHRTNSARSQEASQWSIPVTDKAITPPSWNHNGSAQFEAVTKLGPLHETRSDMDTTEPLLGNSSNGKYVILQPLKPTSNATVMYDYTDHDSLL